MRLFFALCRKKMPPGNIFSGKHRLVKKVTLSDVNKLRNSFEVEERNMFLLRHPYLTMEQSHGHVQALGRTKETKYIAMRVKVMKPFKKDVTIEERLAHLRHGEAWE